MKEKFTQFFCKRYLFDLTSGTSSIKPVQGLPGLQPGPLINDKNLFFQPFIAHHLSQSFLKQNSFKVRELNVWHVTLTSFNYMAGMYMYLQIKRVERLDLINQSVNNFFVVFFLLKCSKYAIPNDQQTTVVSVQTKFVASFINQNNVLIIDTKAG